MHDYNTILGVIELRLSKVSYDSVQKRYRIQTERDCINYEPIQGFRLIIG